jgi:4-amino-4-deoxy-L-arabinose transferase-like glycosyltransferase
MIFGQRRDFTGMPQAARTGTALSKVGAVDASIALAMFLAAFAYFHHTLHLTLELRDEGFLFLNISRAARGEIPHRDFIEVYGPGVYALTAPVFHFFGDRVLPVREILAIFRASAVAFSYIIARHLTPRPFALLAALVAMAYWGRSIWIFTTPYAALFTIPLCMLSLILLLRAETTGNRRTYLSSGFVCGVAMLFKWSLAAMSAYGMILAISASGMLRDSPSPDRRKHPIPVIAVVALAGAASVVPFLEILTPTDYLLHFAPFHALLALVVVHFSRNGDGSVWLAHTAPRAVSYFAGFSVAPLAVAALYFSWGALGDLFYNMVHRPLHYINYYFPISAPPFRSVLLLVCIVAWISALMAQIRRSRRLAILLVALAIVTTPFAYFANQSRGGIELSLAYLTQQLPALTMFATLPFVALALARPGGLRSRRSLGALIAALLFQGMMTFQIFPRGAYNIILILGTLAPVIAYLTYRWYLLATPGDGGHHFLRHAVGFVLVASLPAVFVAGAIRSAFPPDTSQTAEPGAAMDTALHAPALAGIRPKREDYEREDFAAFDALIIHLEQMLPADAPIFVVHNEPMIYFASGRDHLFADHALILFLAGWNLLSEIDRDIPSPSAMIERLASEPNTIIISRRKDKSVRDFRRRFRELARYISEHYAVETTIGDYRVLRRISAV